MNGKGGGVGGSWGLGVATKPQDSISGRSCFWNRGTEGMQAGQGRLPRGIREEGCSPCQGCRGGTGNGGIRVPEGLQLVVKRETQVSLKNGG